MPDPKCLSEVGIPGPRSLPRDGGGYARYRVVHQESGYTRRKEWLGIPGRGRGMCIPNGFGYTRGWV